MGLRQVNAQFRIAHGGLIQRSRAELLVSGNTDRADFIVTQQFLFPAQCIAQELHRALVEWRKMELSLHAQNAVQVFFRLDELLQVIRKNLLG